MWCGRAGEKSLSGFGVVEEASRRGFLPTTFEIDKEYLVGAKQGHPGIRVGIVFNTQRKMVMVPSRRPGISADNKKIRVVAA